jgi:thioredoxin 1
MQVAMPIHVGQADFETEVLQAKQPVLVDFYADWCGPCRALAPIIEEIARDLDGRLKVAKLNVDENNDLSMNYGVQSIPTLILFRDGKEIERIVGFLTKAQLVKTLEQHLSTIA